MRIFTLVNALFLSLSVWAKPLAPVKVRIQKNQQQIELSGFGLYLQPALNTNTKSLPSLLPKKKTYKVSLHRSGGQLAWKIVNKEGEEFLYKNQKLVFFGDMLKANGEHIPSGSYLFLKSKGIDVISELSIENYLAGVLPSEMPAHWPMEALKAQAVASRSYTLSLMEERKHWHYHLEATVKDQVYKFINHIGAEEGIRRKVKRALKETEGQYLLYKNGQVYRAYYHADSGGQTTYATTVWGHNYKGQSSSSVKSPISTSPHGLWEYKMNRKHIEARLNRYFGRQSILKDIRLGRADKSGRVLELIFEFENGKRVLSSNKFRELFGYGTIKSTMFKIFKEGDRLHFSGRGFGHGVGLCQWSTRALAQRGLGYEKILQHFYPITELKNNNDEEELPQSMKSAAAY